MQTQEQAMIEAPITGGNLATEPVLEAPAYDIDDQASVAKAIEDWVLIDDDGVLMDASTGEVVSYKVNPEPKGMTEEERKAHQADVAIWVLKRIQKADAKAASNRIDWQSAIDEYDRLREATLERFERSPEVLQVKAIMDNCTAIDKRASETGRRLREAFSALLRDFALANLRGKDRSYKTPYGTVSLVKNPAKLKVEDEGKAIKWAERVKCDAAIKKSFLISKVVGELKEKLMTGTHSREAAGMTLVPESETVEVKTGVAS